MMVMAMTKNINMTIDVKIAKAMMMTMDVIVIHNCPEVGYCAQALIKYYGSVQCSVVYFSASWCSLV